jgi:hypothetical protein
LVYFIVIWYIFPVLVAPKNLATLFCTRLGLRGMHSNAPAKKSRRLDAVFLQKSSKIRDISSLRSICFLANKSEE